MLHFAHLEPGEEHFFFFKHGRKKFCHYGYRDYDDTLFSHIAESLNECRQKRFGWVGEKILSHPQLSFQADEYSLAV